MSSTFKYPWTLRRGLDGRRNDFWILQHRKNTKTFINDVFERQNMNMKNATICLLLTLTILFSHATAQCVNQERSGFYSEDWIGTWYTTTGIKYTITANGENVHADYVSSGQACSFDGKIIHMRPPNKSSPNSRQDYIEGTWSNPSSNRGGNILLWMTSDCKYFNGIYTDGTYDFNWMQENVYGWETCHKV